MQHDPDSTFRHPLVSTQWLAEHHADAHLRIIDTRKGDGYASAHIPGAVALGASPFLREDGDVIGAEAFAALMSNLGVTGDTEVIAYDDGNGLFAARLWWVLNLYGHARVRVLDGGWDAWSAEKRPASPHATHFPSAAFEARRDARWIASTEDVRQGLDRADRVLLDVRGDEEWMRTESADGATAGHIPGARHVVWTDFVETKTRRLKSPTEIRARLRAAAVDPDREIVTYCQGGIRAAHALLALHAAGLTGVRNYEGSWAAWVKHGQPVDGSAA